ncbi:hypothetical protein KF707_22550 [Candidatus Obscuribacterales bacterium]|nr:hypothetical protein [Candidatus Obscuribacterales bacterium]MBX3139025.1 hypothetical protein [Candidatus Obscuribacterales bacterium]MBX3152579.1 hypothetical protein [Candidatus Obscuribacterales bacterium]
MRVELIYAPGCNNYQKVLKRLEMVIAEERLPVPIELVEETRLQDDPMIRIDGEAVGIPKVLTCADAMRDAISKAWREMAVNPLLAGY